MKNTNDLGEYIKKTRENLGLSQRELAKLANINNAEISRLEAGKRQKPNVLILKAIAEALNLSLAGLMKRAGYDDTAINWGINTGDRRSVKDYQNALDEYNRFYFDVLDNISMRRNNTLECKSIYTDIIDRIEHPECYKEPITMQEIATKLKEVSRLSKPNLEKLDKSIYPKIDGLVFIPQDKRKYL